jgi:hypothetical protein
VVPNLATSFVDPVWIAAAATSAAFVVGLYYVFQNKFELSGWQEVAGFLAAMAFVGSTATKITDVVRKEDPPKSTSATIAEPEPPAVAGTSREPAKTAVANFSGVGASTGSASIDAKSIPAALLVDVHGKGCRIADEVTAPVTLSGAVSLKVTLAIDDSSAPTARVRVSLWSQQRELTHVFVDKTKQVFLENTIASMGSAEPHHIRLRFESLGLPRRECTQAEATVVLQQPTITQF